MMGRLDDKIAVITGASRGIGRACALALAREGAHLAVIARTQSDLDTLVGEVEALGRCALAVAGDASEEADVARLKEQALGAFGRVDILVNNAGVGKYGPVHTLSAQDYDWMMKTNMRSTFLCTQAFLPEMLARREGCIIFIASVSGLRATPNQAVYSATKFAQVGFAQGLDHEVREHGIRVSVIAPGGTRTHFALGTGRSLSDAKRQKYLEADAVAQAVIFAATQPPGGRTFLIGMRAMFEAL